MTVEKPPNQFHDTEPQSDIAGSPAGNNVRSLFTARPASKREAPPTNAEILEYRRIRPRLLKMLDEWEVVRDECPLARKILQGDS
jgi:hypothetical protein